MVIDTVWRVLLVILIVRKVLPKLYSADCNQKGFALPLQNSLEWCSQRQKLPSFRKKRECSRAGCLWLSGISSSIAYNWSRPHMKTSVKLIHARMHAQALTLAALVGSGLVEYYDKEYGSSGPKVDRYTRQYVAHSHKD
ncbi:hypothetical protein ACQ4PT_067285 [Festuca glaucescens]